MVDLKINFLKKKRAISEQEYLRERRIFIITLTGFLGLFMIMVAFFSLQLLSLWQVKKTKTKLTQAETKLAGLKEVSAQQLYLRNRLDIVKSFLDSRVKGRDAIEKIFSLSVPGVVITNVAFVDEQNLKISLEADSVVALDQTFKWFKNDDFFPQVVNKGVSKSVSGGYVTQLMLTVPKGGAKW